MAKKKSTAKKKPGFKSKAEENKKKKGTKADGGYSPKPISIVVQPGQEIRIIGKGPAGSIESYDDGGDPTVTPSVKSP